MSDLKPFKDRAEGGRLLARKLRHYARRNDVIILGLPRGGVEVAYEVAKVLEAPLDVFVVRKIGMPGHEEMAVGAIASGGIAVMNEEAMAQLAPVEARVREVIERERKELGRRERLYREDRAMPAVKGKTVILVDDGLATGSTMHAAVQALRRLSPERIVVAVPVASPGSCELFKKAADECICAVTPEFFYAVGNWYENFTPTSDETVKKLLELSERRMAARHVSERYF
jgi:predicted phosphoribosyltransferase